MAAMRRNIYISPFWEEDYGKLAELLGEDHVLFGSDYPHPEGLEQPGRLRERPRAPRPTSWSRKFMGGNLAKLMNVENTPRRPGPRHRLTPARPDRCLAPGTSVPASSADALAVEGAVDEAAEVVGVERLELGAEREVDRRQHGTLHVHVQHPLRRLDRVLRQLGDPPGARQRLRRTPRRASHTWLASPIWWARSAVIRSPVNANSLASSMLVCSGHVIGPPSAATRPTTTCGSARWAFAAMYTTSESATRLHPRPTAGPLTAATTGTRHCSMFSTRRLPCRCVTRRSARSSASSSEVVEVAAGRERPAVAGEHHGPGLAVEADLREQVGEPLVQVVVDGVEVVRAVQADDADRAVGLDHDLVGHVVHGVLPRLLSMRRGRVV